MGTYWGSCWFIHCLADVFTVLIPLRIDCSPSTYFSPLFHTHPACSIEAAILIEDGYMGHQTGSVRDSVPSSFSQRLQSFSAFHQDLQRELISHWTRLVPYVTIFAMSIITLAGFGHHAAKFQKSRSNRRYVNRCLDSLSLFSVCPHCFVHTAHTSTSVSHRNNPHFPPISHRFIFCNSCRFFNQSSLFQSQESNIGAAHHSLTFVGLMEPPCQVRDTDLNRSSITARCIYSA